MSGRPAAPVAIIADDESLGRLLLAEAAAAAGLTPLSFDNGTEALQAALSQEVAMVLLDVEMPGLNGFEVCRQLRVEKRASLPIVMVTGLDDRGAVNNAFEAGATDFVTKPVNWPLLPHRLAYILRNADREARIVTLVDAMPDMLWVVSPTGEVRWTQGQESLKAVIPTPHFADVLAAIHQTAQDGHAQKTELRDLDGSVGGLRSCELRFTRVEGGDVLVVRQDTSERTRAARHIEKLAFYDPLTGLPNRQHCLDQVTRALTLAKEKDEGLALLYVDLNNFKRINDTFGHSIGDVILQRVAAMLQSLLASRGVGAPPTFLARLGGDEFVVMLCHPAPRSIATELAAAICAALAKPVAYETLEFLATPSIGIAVYPEDGKNVETLLKHADTAMYQAKINGGPKVVAYMPAMSAKLRDSLELETRLRRALRDDALQVRYQPKFQLRDGALVGAEALLRWFDEELGDISPNRFIPVAEESGLIVDIGAWIMRAVCDQLRVWHAHGIAVPIAVNVSGKELLFADPSRIIKAETDRAGVPTSLIEAEITESVFVTDLTTARSSVNRIRQLGCRIALDDFGTGYSSLSYLTRFPPDRVKIDRSFIANVDRSESDGAIVKAIISLAKSLNLLVTAEGIERPRQLTWLKTFGCDEVQGYLLAKPLSAGELEGRFLKQDPITGDSSAVVRIA
ncbi:MAG: EAL domain-containing protein [Gammaproteobacteria bacterium]